MARASRSRHFSDTLVRAAMSLFGLGLVLLALEPLLGGSSSAALQALASGLAMPAPLVLLSGLVLGAVGHALKPKDGAGRGAADASLLTADSTDFVGTLSPAPDAAPAQPRPGRAAPARSWCPQVFDDIEWRRFQAVCERLFARYGLKAYPKAHGAEAADLWLHADDGTAPLAVVRCRPGRDHIVGVHQLRELRGVAASHGGVRATYATASSFTPEALQFARAHGIETLDAEGLLERIARLSPAEQQALLAQAYEGEYWRPTCAHCGLKTVEHSPRGGAAFWACADAPRCRFTLPLQPRA